MCLTDKTIASSNTYSLTAHTIPRVTEMFSDSIIAFYIIDIQNIVCCVSPAFI